MLIKYYAEFNEVEVYPKVNGVGRTLGIAQKCLKILGKWPSSCSEAHLNFIGWNKSLSFRKSTYWGKTKTKKQSWPERYFGWILPSGNSHLNHVIVPPWGSAWWCLTHHMSEANPIARASKEPSLNHGYSEKEKQRGRLAPFHSLYKFLLFPSFHTN